MDLYLNEYFVGDAKKPSKMQIIFVEATTDAALFIFLIK